MSDEERKNNVVKTLGDLKEAVAEIKEENLLEHLQRILDAKATKVNINYEDIDESMSFIVRPLTVAIQIELDMFETTLERYKHLISKLVTTTDNRPLSYKEIDMMPYGMQQTLVAIVEELSFSHQTVRQKLDS